MFYVICLYIKAGIDLVKEWNGVSEYNQFLNHEKRTLKILFPQTRNVYIILSNYVLKYCIAFQPEFWISAAGGYCVIHADQQLETILKRKLTIARSLDDIKRLCKFAKRSMAQKGKITNFCQSLNTKHEFLL